MIETNPVITAVNRLIEAAYKDGISNREPWKFAIEAARCSIAQPGDRLLLSNGDFVEVVKAWHGKDGAWVTVKRTVENADFTRDVELWEIASSERFSERMQAQASTSRLIPLPV